MGKRPAPYIPLHDRLHSFLTKHVFVALGAHPKLRLKTRSAHSPGHRPQ
eukprot:NODE_8270_length_252_cov_387.192118_g7110_i0.p4 GENE.NODE_8270_length_252_cov_387.192118_g7110_i0~~NODE_8270_length_252_cov_387.192118_g7110_i0.p4  ORF type:complete len:57 (-),score=29.49 NODE_8270_length_252_cov_387.192118_g7110_i0:80-226(-)